MILVWFCIMWLLGIVVGDRLDLPMMPTTALAGALAALGVIWWPRRDLRVPVLLVAVFLLGGARIAVAQPHTTAHSVWAYAGADVVLQGYVAAQPDRREDRQRAMLHAERMVVNGQERAVHGQVLLRVAPVPTLHYGERLRVTGTLETPPSDDDFDYRAYLARRNVHVLMTEPDWTLLPGNDGAWWQRTALQLNDHARYTGLHVIGEPHASLLIGILLGIQSTIPDDILDAFSATGTSHILVISGWNITIIIIGITALLGQLGINRKRAAAVSIPLLAAYVVFVGASPAVLRAALMGGLVVFATLVDRETEAWTSFFVACSLMALLDPHVLWDLGFQLSALATAGLFALARPLQGWLVARPPFRWQALGWAVEPLTATLAASSLSLPLILYQFGNLSLIAPLANVLMLPAVPYAMLWGSLATLCGMVWLPLGELVALLAWPFLHWLLVTAEWLARVPGAFTNIGSFHVGWVWGYYVLVAAVKFTTEARRHREKETPAEA